MADGNTRATATQILTQLASLLGVESPTATTVTPGHTTPVVTRRQEQGQSGSSTNGLARSEMSRLFAPYPRPSTSAAGLRLTGRPALRHRSIPVRNIRPWTARYCCLGGPSESKTPIESRMLLLKRHGLGEEVITIDPTATIDALKAALESTFPKLVAVGVVLYRALTGGKGKPLVRVSNTEPVPGVLHLRASRLAVIYVQPVSDILSVAEGIEQPLPHVAVDVQLDQPIPVDSEELHQGLSAEPEVNLQLPRSNYMVTPVGDGRQPSALNSTLEGAVNQHLPLSEVTRNDTSANSSPSIEGELLTLDHYREQIYMENEGFQYILASRERFLEKILGIYKDPAFNFLKKPKVEFQGEPGADIGAITREYFWKGLTAIVQDKIDGLPAFEGELDHKVPATDGRLLRAGVFKTIGKFLGHAALHCGIAFIGLSEAVAQYVFLETVDSDTPLPITVEDVPELHVREAVALLAKLQSGATLTEDEAAHVQEVAESSEFGETVDKHNSGFVIEQVLYHAVVDRRVAQLEAIKAGFKCAGLNEFLKGKSYLVESLFPRSSALNYPSSLLISKIECHGRQEMLSVVTSFIESLELRGLQNLLSAWTGWPVLPEDPLIVRFEDDVDFMVRACFNEIQIPNDLSCTELVEKLNLVVRYASNGFGGV